MPDLVHIRNEDPARTSMLDSILRFITTETESTQPGSDVIVDKPSEVLLIHVIRVYMKQTGVKTGLLAALSDTKLGRVIKAVHEDPGLTGAFRSWQKKLACRVLLMPVTFKQ